MVGFFLPEVAITLLSCTDDSILKSPVSKLTNQQFTTHFFGNLRLHSSYLNEVTDKMAMIENLPRTLLSALKI